MKSHGYAAHDNKSALVPYSFERRDPGPRDVVVEIAYCGICHSDIHQVRNEWGGSMYPMVPGHEIVGRVTAVGAEVARFKVGDLAGIGVLVDSCRVCPNCKASLEQYCEKGFVGTYNAKGYDGVMMHGGYANNIVCDKRYVHTHLAQVRRQAGGRRAAALRGHHHLLAAAPLGRGPGQEGRRRRPGRPRTHGAEVRALLRRARRAVHHQREQDRRRQASRRRRGRHLQGRRAMAKHAASFDLILDCVSAPHDLNAYLDLLRLDGTLCLVGLPEKPLPVAPFSLTSFRSRLPDRTSAA